MIKKDISYSNQEYQLDKYDEADVSDIDAIFAEADNQMAVQNSSLSIKFKDNKKKKRSILRFILSSLLIFLIIVGVFVALGIYSIKTTYPQMKETFLEQVSSMREQLIAIDDSELTIDQCYQKKILLLFTTEDFEAALGNVEDIDTVLRLIMSGGELDLSVLPEEKIEAYNKLLEDYERAKQEEVSSSKYLSETETENVLDDQKVATTCN